MATASSKQKIKNIAETENVPNKALKTVRDSFIEGAGKISTTLLGMLNRVCGQIYALLFLSSKPLSLDDIVEELRVSKGNVSINIRLLEDYKLVRKVWVKGSRRDYYEAVDTLPKQIIKEFFDKMRRNILDSLDMIHDCCALAEKTEKEYHPETDFVRARLNLIRSFYENAHLLFDMIYSGQTIDASVLKPILNGTDRSS